MISLDYGIVDIGLIILILLYISLIVYVLRRFLALRQILRMASILFRAFYKLCTGDSRIFLVNLEIFIEYDGNISALIRFEISWNF